MSLYCEVSPIGFLCLGRLVLFSMSYKRLTHNYGILYNYLVMVELVTTHSVNSVSKTLVRKKQKLRSICLLTSEHLARNSRGYQTSRHKFGQWVNKP